MTTGGKSIELIVDHLLCGLGPWWNLAVGPELCLRIVVVSSDVAGCGIEVELLSSACKACTNTAAADTGTSIRRAVDTGTRIRRAVDTGITGLLECGVQRPRNSFGNADWHRHLDWIIFLRSRTPEYVAKLIAFFRLLYESRWALTAPDLLPDRLRETWDSSAVVDLQSTP